MLKKCNSLNSILVILFFAPMISLVFSKMYPLAETIQICADTLYIGQLPLHQFLKEIFIELMNKATKSVEFSFNDVMYKQTDGVALGSPLDPALANVFDGYYENKLFASSEKPLLYTQYVDDSFAIFRSEVEADKFFTIFNSLHLTLKFSMEKEANQTLPFLDVKIEKNNDQFLTSTYRKPTFTDQYICLDSFGPSKHKTKLIGTLVH